MLIFLGMFTNPEMSILAHTALLLKAGPLGLCGSTSSLFGPLVCGTQPWPSACHLGLIRHMGYETASHFSFCFKFFHFLFVCVSAYTRHTQCVDVGGQLEVVSSRLPWCEFWTSNSGHQAW